LHVFSPRSFRATRRLLRELKPDVVVVWNLYMASLAPLVAAELSGVPTVVQLFDKWLYYGLCDLQAVLGPVVRWRRLAVALVEGLLQPPLRWLARPRRMLAVSRFIKDFYVGAGFAADSIEVVHLAVPTAEFQAVPRARRQPGEPLRLLYVGSLWEGKGPQTALRALSRLVHAGVPAELDICGGGRVEFVEFLKRLIASEGLEQRVRLHGHVERTRVRRFYQSRDVLVFPSQWDEPYAAVPLEAMSCGLPVVGTTAGGTPEAIEDGLTGLLVPPADPERLAAALMRLASDEDLRLRLAANAARLARERFDLEPYVNRLEARYRAAADERRSQV
jgi:glycosyltransferase involved in cell wall biosynthesis